MQKMNKALVVAVLAGGCLVSTSAWADAPRQSCSADADCAEGVACIDGVCGQDQGVDDRSECDVDADCAAGFSCQVVGATDCAVPPRDPNSPDEPVLPCASEEFRMCVPPPPAQCDPAQMSADCSGGLICVTYTFESCSGGVACACPDGVDCDCADVEPSEPSCQSEAQSYCVPPYLAPCDADADCGSGFTCEAEEICTASCVDGPRDPADPSDDPGMGSCSSECAPSSTKYCKIVERPCAADAECGAGFSCVAPPSSSTPSTCVVDSDGNEFCDDGAPDEQPGQAYCLPDGWEQWGGAPGRDSESPVSSGNEGELIGAEPARPPRQDDSGFPEASDADANAAGGCMSSAGGNAAGSGLGLLALMAGMLGWRRRRA